MPPRKAIMSEQYPPNAGQPDDEVALTDADKAPAEAEIEKLNGQVAELNDRILRLAAEVENTRRRGEREKQDAARYAIASFARDLLRVTDTFERALGAMPEDPAAASPETLSAIVAGVKMTDKELLSVLERHGVKKISPKGEKFDPNLHQAVAQAPGDQPSGHVQDVAQPGYVIGDRVLRAAMVVVSTGPAAKPNGAEPGGHVDTSA
jgi:molecular chaperone GrpE